MPTAHAVARSGFPPSRERHLRRNSCRKRSNRQSVDSDHGDWLLERAYANFFARQADFPRFKKKGQSDSFRYPDPKQIKLDQANARIFLPKLGWLRYRNSRQALGAVKNITVSQSCGKWFVSIQTEREIEQPIPQGGAVGIDMGIARFATLSDGAFYAPLNSFKRHETALRRAQQAMSRKVKFSSNWKKAEEHVQIVGRYNRAAGQKRSGQVRPEQVHPRSRMGRVPPPTGLQTGVERWTSHRRAGAEHQPQVSMLRPCVGGQPPDASTVPVCGMRFRGKRRSGRRDQCAKGGTRPVSL